MSLLHAMLRHDERLGETAVAESSPSPAANVPAGACGQSPAEAGFSAPAPPPKRPNHTCPPPADRGAAALHRSTPPPSVGTQRPPEFLPPTIGRLTRRLLGHSVAPGPHFPHFLYGLLAIQAIAVNDSNRPCLLPALSPGPANPPNLPAAPRSGADRRQRGNPRDSTYAHGHFARFLLDTPRAGP